MRSARQAEYFGLECGGQATIERRQSAKGAHHRTKPVALDGGFDRGRHPRRRVCAALGPAVRSRVPAASGRAAVRRFAQRVRPARQRFAECARALPASASAQCRTRPRPSPRCTACSARDVVEPFQVESGRPRGSRHRAATTRIGRDFRRVRCRACACRARRSDRRRRRRPGWPLRSPRSRPGRARATARPSTRRSGRACARR